VGQEIADFLLRRRCASGSSGGLTDLFHFRRRPVSHSPHRNRRAGARIAWNSRRIPASRHELEGPPDVHGVLPRHQRTQAGPKPSCHACHAMKAQRNDLDHGHPKRFTFVNPPVRKLTVTNEREILGKRNDSAFSPKAIRRLCPRDSGPDALGRLAPARCCTGGRNGTEVSNFSKHSQSRTRRAA